MKEDIGLESGEEVFVFSFYPSSFCLDDDVRISSLSIFHSPYCRRKKGLFELLDACWIWERYCLEIGDIYGLPAVKGRQGGMM